MQTFKCQYLKTENVTNDPIYCMQQQFAYDMSHCTEGGGKVCEVCVYSLRSSSLHLLPLYPHKAPTHLLHSSLLIHCTSRTDKATISVAWAGDVREREEC